MKSFFVLFSLGLAALAHASVPPHLDLEMTSEEYAAHLNTLARTKSLKFSEPSVERAIAIGTRLSKWIKIMNENRAPETAIRLTSAATRRGIPIDKPNMYNPSIIQEKMDQALKASPAEIRDVLLSSADLPGTMAMDDETFIKHAREIDRQYQSAARYKSVDRYRPWYYQAASRDVRGYHYLVTHKITAEDLKDVSSIPSEKMPALKDALIKICWNGDSIYNGCDKKVETAIKRNALSAFYQKYFPHAQRTWNAFFEIPASARRRDIEWSGSIATVPFNTPSIAKFIPYLQDNIEDEFRWEGWGLKLNFGTFSSGPRLIFRPGEVPHVNGLGGNEIVMDSNQPIEEYESQWTIRHEFGHVVGLPDCYHEFYDTEKQAYVNYQLDITDLMCSRAGNMNERIYLELKKAYAK